jgi:RNA polymerase sigma-70 factor (ECF subfamily)
MQDRTRSEARDGQLAGLLQQVAQGNTTAFEAFYAATIGCAQALARRLLRTGDMEDALADAYLQVWRQAGRFDARHGSAMGYLLNIVRSRALDALRRQKLRPVGTDPDELALHPSEAQGPPELLAAAQQGARLHAAVAGLSAHERWLVGLAYFSELTHSTISQQTGLPLGSVKSSIHRAHAKLRKVLSGTTAAG